MQVTRRLLKLQRGGRSTPDARPTVVDEPTPPTPPEPPTRVDAGWLGLRDAALAGWFDSETGELFTDMPVDPGDTVLDVGCGEGGMLLFCARRGARVIGVDIQVETVEAVRARLSAEGFADACFHVAPAERLPLEDGSVTRVICTEVLEHVDDPQVVLAELLRVGAPGARYLLTVPDALTETLMQHVAPAEYFERPNHIRIVSREEFPAMVSAAGFEILRQDSYGFFWSVWWALFCTTGEGRPAPPNPVLDHWAAAWSALLDSPQGAEYQRRLDAFLPKSQVIIARKPG